MQVSLPEYSLVLLVGVSGSGKSTFARQHFKPTEILSSDMMRGWVTDDESDQSATGDAFELLHALIRKRLNRMRLTVVDATNLNSGDREKLLALAKEYHALSVALVFNIPERICVARNAARTDRQLPPHVIPRQLNTLHKSLRSINREGFHKVFVFKSEAEANAVTLERTRLWNDLRHEHGPFDIIGDVHGCFTELRALLSKLNYHVEGHNAVPPDGRKAVFVGDLVDRGPDSAGVLRLVMNMVAAGTALCVPGNHDAKLLKKLQGKNVHVAHGLALTLEQLAAEPPEFTERVKVFLDKLISHYVLDGGKLAVAHAGMKESMLGRTSGAVREFALYGETTGERDEFGLPVRVNWAENYRGNTLVVYGHTPVVHPVFLNNTINIDTGCVFGGSLSAIRYPERELVAVPAERVYAEPSRPIDFNAPLNAVDDGMIDISDLIGRKMIDTALMRAVTIREEHAAAALEIMSRFAVDPRWLIYLPPTMSPVETSQEPDLLEHPAEAFAYFHSRGVAQVICEEKHMGSRAVVVVCRDEKATRDRFGITDACGIVYTRTGRRFFEDANTETALIDRLRAAITTAGWWESLETDWVALDCELMPWSAKAQELLRTQYAAVGAAASLALPQAVASLAEAQAHGLDVDALSDRIQARAALIPPYIEAYRRYCWAVDGIDGLKLAPFHLLASEGKVHIDQPHTWHIETLAALHKADGVLFHPTATRLVDLNDAESVESATRWWHDLTANGGEGMVVKPLDYVHRGAKGLTQPALKVRGREYLRIIYGAEYTARLDVLRRRNVRAKRSLALREFALGVEGLQRFVAREALWRVHQCAFGVLALESEPVDPRL